MGARRKAGGKPGSGKKKKRRSGKRWGLLLLSLLAGGVVVWQRGDLVVGVESYLGVGEKAREIVDVGDLAGPGSPRSGSVVSVLGIPDYESRLRLPSGDRVMTCFRMTGFEDRLFICSEGTLETPEDIEDIIQKRTFVGRMERVEESRLRETLRSGFDRAHKISLSRNALLVLVGNSHVPSVARTVALSGCAILCILFLLRFILS